MGSHKQKWLAAIVIALLAITATTGAVYAYLSATTDPVDNKFTTAPNPTLGIQETFTKAHEDANIVKENVRVNIGNPGYAVYVRAAIVITWKDGKGNVYGQAPVLEDDYALELNTKEWFKGGDGFYYHKNMVAYDGNNEATKLTSVLIEACSQLKTGPESYTLHVEIVAQTIQAKGSTDVGDVPAVEDAWRTVVVNEDGTLSPR